MTFDQQANYLQAYFLHPTMQGGSSWLLALSLPVTFGDLDS
jgi:hypothetical protein